LVTVDLSQYSEHIDATQPGRQTSAQAQIPSSVADELLLPIPLVDLKAQFLPLEEEIIGTIRQVLHSMHLYLGPHLEAFERAFAEYCTVGYCIGVGTGTDALVTALRACGVGQGDEVITASHTFIATAEAIVLSGAHPVFVDIDPYTYTIDPSRIEERVTPHTRAIIPVHLYGQMADMDSISHIAERRGLRVIEDACQAHGATYRGRRAGSIGEVATFSFYFSKNLGAYGEGGAVTTNDPEIDQAVRLLRNHGQSARYYHDILGTNARMDEIQAAVLGIKLRYLDEWNARRRQHAQTYRRLLAGTPLTLPEVAPDREHVYHLYVVRAPDRDRLRDWLQQRQVNTGIHYPVPIHMQQAFSAYDGPTLPVTEIIAAEMLSLPMYPELSDKQLEYIAECIHEFYETK
jgi:dTDP-4-amino-4,6-dideoxygalactose transaminase